MDDVDEYGREWEDGDDIYSGTATNDPEFWDERDVIHTYSWEQAVEDKTLYTFARESWDTLNGGRPILMSIGVYSEMGLMDIVSAWNEYVTWRREVEPTLPEEDRLFSYDAHGKTVWIVDDGTAITVLFPDEY